MVKTKNFITADTEQWDAIWHEQQEVRAWDYLSEVVFQALKKDIDDFNAKRIIETGSGSGRISCRLAENSAKVILADYSYEALNASRRVFRANKTDAVFIQADIHNMPLKHGSCDVVWNAGVMEHYPYDDQANIFTDLIRICKKDGLVITLNPYSRSIFYNLGKLILMVMNKWIFGKEYPIKTLRDIYVDKGEGRIIKEYSIGFIVFFIDAYKFFPKKLQFLMPGKLFSGIAIKYSSQLFYIDKVLSKIFGGYLIVSVFKKA